MHHYIFSGLAFLLSLFLIISGHGKIGLSGLIQMILGLSGLLTLLYLYNRKKA